jgi:hypothetical protein
MTFERQGSKYILDVTFEKRIEDVSDDTENGIDTSDICLRNKTMNLFEKGSQASLSLEEHSFLD